MSTVVCTLGMHRSGTSLVSRMLNLLGVELGPSESMLGIAADNPKGHWEHHEITLLNEEILAAFGGSWHEPPALPEAWTSDPRLADVRDRAEQLLMRDFGTSSMWGWKDPRTCVTLPFWQNVVGEMRYVLCIRNPLAVMASLLERNGMDVEIVDPLWLRHVQSSLDHTSGLPRLLVFYEDVLSDGARELGRMAAFIGRPERAEDPQVRDDVAHFLEQKLWHHRPSAESLAANGRVSLTTKRLYLSLTGQEDLIAAHALAAPGLEQEREAS